MDKYEVELLENAYRDLDEIYTYIANEISAPETARKQLNRLKGNIGACRISEFTSRQVSRILCGQRV